MQEDILLQISNKIKEIRQRKGATLQSIADNAGVTKGLISQIENSRTAPSLQVLLSIIKALDIDLNEFFKGIHTGNEQNAIVRKKDDYQPFEKENAKGFIYHRILSTTLHDIHLDIVTLRLQKNAKRPMVRTNAYEFKYVLQGKVEYTIGDTKHMLEEGDSLFFDARQLHNPRNAGKDDALMLVIYFFHKS